MRLRNHPPASLSTGPVPALVWQPLLPGPSGRLTLNLRFRPYPTVHTAADGQRQAAYVALLYLAAPAPASPGPEESSLHNLASGVLAWTLNSLLGSTFTDTTYEDLLARPVTAEDLALLLRVFTGGNNNGVPFDYASSTGHDARSFLQQLFTITIGPAPARDPGASGELPPGAAVFPPFPELQLQTSHNGIAAPLIDFAAQSPTDDQPYLADVGQLLGRLGEEPESAPTIQAQSTGPASDNPGAPSPPSQSLPTFLFTHYLALLARHLLRASLHYLRAAGPPTTTVAGLLAQVCSPAAVAGLPAVAARLLLRGLRLPPPPPASGPAQPLYVLTGQQVTLPAEVKAGDTFTIQLLNGGAASWLALGPAGTAATSLPFTIGADELAGIAQLVATPLAPLLLPGFPRARASFRDHAPTFALGQPVRWQHPAGADGAGASAHLFELPASLLAQLPTEADFSLYALGAVAADAVPVVAARWATAVAVTIEKLPLVPGEPAPPGQLYRLAGTDRAGTTLVQHLVAYLNSAAGQNLAGEMQVLYPAADGYASALPADQLALAIVPTSPLADAAPQLTGRPHPGSAPAAPPLSPLARFATLLWECSTGHPGGYYLHYGARGATPISLPEELFDARGVATVQVLITYPGFVGQPFLNQLVVADALDYRATTVVAQADTLRERSATMPPGAAGYELGCLAASEQQPTTPAASPPPAAQLEKLFRFVGLSLPDVPDYQHLVPASAVAPLAPAAGPGRHYHDAVPYAQLAPPAPQLYGLADPYAGVGSSATLLLHWQDPFGNALPFEAERGTVSSPLRYTDPLPAVSQWPSAVVGYGFGGTPASPEVQLTFGFAADRYQGEDAARQAARDLPAWLRLWHQLQHAPDLDLSFTLSLDGTADAPLGSARPLDLGALQSQLVRPVAGYLHALATGGAAPAAPGPYVVRSAIAPASLATYSDLLPLAVSLTLRRTAHLDPDFATTPGVASMATTVPPLGITPGSAAELAAFAQQFEDLFNAAGPVQLKVAAAADRPGAGGAAPGRSALWIVRFDATGQQGIGLRYGPSAAQRPGKPARALAYYAPAPLATSRLSFAATTYAYQTGQPYPGEGALSRLIGVDLDSWGQQFLAAVDHFLTPTYAVPAFLLDEGATLQRVFDMKQRLAEAIAGTVTAIIEPDAVPPQDGERSARQKWRQQLLLALSSAYSYSAAVQMPVQVHAHWPHHELPGAGSPPSLYGQLVGQPASGLLPEDFSLSAARLPLGEGDAWLPYLVRCRHPADFTSLDFSALQFAISHLEWPQLPGAGAAGCPGSLWLALVRPQALPAQLTAVGAGRVPLPLRTSPAAPVASQPQALPAASPSANAVLDARGWAYQFSYPAPEASQDVVTVQVHFNADPAEPGPTAPPASDTLPQALARFVSVYSALSTDLDRELTRVTGPASEGPAWQAAQVFCLLAEDVATAWLQRRHAPRQPAGPAPHPPQPTQEPALAPAVLHYEVTESALPGPGWLLLTVTAPASSLNPLPGLLAIDVAGHIRQVHAQGPGWVQYTYAPQADPTGPPLRFADRQLVPHRRATVPGLDILAQQRSTVGFASSRNQRLLPAANAGHGWQATTRPFIHQVPVAGFLAPLVPRLPSPAPIDLATLPLANAPATRALADNLAALGAALTEQVSTASIRVQVEARYAYEVAPGIPSALPVVRTVPFELSTADHGAAFTTDLAATLLGWQQQQQPSETGAQWQLTVSIFPALEGEPPMLTLSLFTNAA